MGSVSGPRYSSTDFLRYLWLTRSNTSQTRPTCYIATKYSLQRQNSLILVL